MKYILMDVVKGDMFTKEFDSAEEAIKEADSEWEALSEYDQNRRETFCVLESANPDEDAEDHLDGNIIKEYK